MQLNRSVYWTPFCVGWPIKRQVSSLFFLFCNLLRKGSLAFSTPVTFSLSSWVLIRYRFLPFFPCKICIPSSCSLVIRLAKAKLNIFYFCYPQWCMFAGVPHVVEVSMMFPWNEIWKGRTRKHICIHIIQLKNNYYLEHVFYCCLIDISNYLCIVFCLWYSYISWKLSSVMFWSNVHSAITKVNEKNQIGNTLV